MRKFFLASIIGLLSVVASAQNWTGSNKTINSGDLRFGNGSELSVNYTGNVQQPFYNSGGNWYQLTYSSYPLDYELASGGNGASSFNRNGTIVQNPTMTNQVFDHSGFIITSGSTGYGTLKVKGNITVGSDLLEVTFSYYIANPNDNFCKITTSIKNVGSATATNLRYWVGTRDDFVGVYDSNTKTKGNIVNGVFTQIPTAATQSKALRISNGSDAVLFYTTSPLANMSHASCCSFTNSSALDPSLSPITASGDGSYAMFIRLPDLGVGQTQTFDWFYAAGSMSEIAQIAAQVASASIAVNNITTNSANLAAFSSNAGTGYYLVVPAGSPAPTAAQIVAGNNYGSVTVSTSGSASVTANTTNNLAMTGLNPLTNYTVYYVTQYMNNSVLTTSAIATQDFTTLFSCGEIFTRVDGNGQATQCPGVSGTPVNSSVIGTAYVNAPTTTKTSSIRYKWSAATFPTIVPVISSVWVNGISSAMQVGPPSVSISSAGEYFVDYCFYNVNLPVTGTYSLRFINPLTGNEVGYCTYNANDNGPTSTPVLVPNVMPTVSSLGTINLPCAASATSPVNFTVSDPETAAGQLIVSATSSNTNLIPNANLVVTQPNASGAASLVYTVASGQVGSAIITVSVLDHLGGIGTRTFTVNVGSTTPISINNSLCGSNGLQWMTMTNISPATAAGTGQNGITVAITQSGSGMLNVNGMYQGNQFPAIYNVPTSGATIANQYAGNFQACFSQPVVNPVVAFSSIGNPSNCVPIVVSQPYSVVWTGQNMTYTSPTQMTGCEGKTIIRIDGTVSCVNFNYLASEYYCTVAFGFENQNCYTPTICSGNSVTLTAGLSSNYVWTPSTGMNTTSGPVVIANPTSTTTYTVSSSTDLCASPTSVTVVVNQTPIITVPSSITEILGTTIPSQTFSSTVPGTTYSWTNSAPAIGLPASGSGFTPSFIASSNIIGTLTGTINVTPTAPNTCVGAPASFPITVISLPNVNDPQNVTNCEGTSTIVDFTGATPNTNYLWTNSNTSIGLAASGSNDISFTSQNATNVPQIANLTVTPQMYLTEGFVWGSVNENGLLTLNAPAGKIFTSVDFASYGTPGGSGGNYTIGACHATNSSVVVSALAIGNSTMSVAANNATFGDPCPTSSKALAVKLGYGVSLTGTPQTFTITVNPSASIANSTDTICTGTAFNFVAAPSDIIPANTSYSWTVLDNPSISGETNQVTPISAVSQTLFNGSSLDQIVTYTVTPTSGTAGCIGSPFTYEVTVTPLPTTVTALGATSFCDGGSVTLTAPVAPLQMSYTYQWNLNGSPIAGATSITYTAIESGSFTVTVTNNAGCSAISQPILVTEYALPTVAPITGNTDICIGGTTTMSSATPGGVWASSNTATATVNSVTGVVTGVSAGSVSISYNVTDVNGCFSKQTTIVNVIAFPVVAAITGPSSVCVGSNVSFLNATSGGVWSSSNTSIATVSSNGTISGVSVGQATITYTVTNATGCVTSVLASITVNALPTPTITASGPVTFCTSGTVTLTASSGSSYLWSNGAQTQSITVSTSGDYYVTTTNSFGCAGTSASTVVTMNANPTVNILAASPTTFCQGSSVVLSATPSTAGNTYLWSTGATTSTISATSTANITVTVTTAAGCSTTSLPTSILVNPNPIATISAGGPTTFCQGGSVALTANSGAGFTYQWSNNTNSQVNTLNAAGSYTVTVTDANGCSTTSAPTVVTVNPLPTTPAITGTASVCIGSTTLLSTTASNPVWSSANTSIATIAANGLVTGVAAGTTQISYTITNANGCTNTTSISLTVNLLPTASISSVGSIAFCQGGSVTLLASTPPAGMTYTYQWNLNGTAITGATANSYAASVAGNYTVTITTNSGCSTTSTAKAITVYPLPSLPANGGAVAVCENATATLTNAQVGGLWSSANNTIAAINAITGQVTGVNPGTTSLIYTYTNANGCTNTSATNFTVNALPSAIISASGPTTFCQGGSVVLTSSPGVSYLWSTGATTASITLNSAQDVSVTVTNVNGCVATSSITSIVVNALPVASITSLNGNTFCQGSSVSLVASTGSSYLWSNGAITQTINATSSGSLTVAVTNANGCTTVSAPFNVTMIPAPSTTITAAGPTSFCAGGSVVLSAPIATSYLWNTGETTQSIVAAVDGPYTVTVTNGSGCIATSPFTNVTVYALPIVQAIAGANNVCVGSSVTLSNATLGGVWTSVNTSLATVSPSGIVTGVGQGVDTLIYTVTNANGCSSSVSFNILVNASSPLTAINGISNICAGSSTTLSNAQVAGVWSSSDVGVATVAANGVVNGITAGTASIIYSYTNSFGCTSSTNQTLVVYALPNAAVANNGPTVFCAGGSVILSAPAGLNYAWSTGSSNQTINVTASGSYDVVVTDQNGCTSISSPIVVTVNPLPPVAIAPIGSTTFCVGGSVTLISLLNSNYSYAWNEGLSAITGGSNNTLVVNSSGSYSLTITDGNGCIATSAPLPVTVNSLPAVVATPNGATTFCDGGSVTLSASGAATYLWSNGSSSPSITVSSSDDYFVVGTDAAGCSATSIPVPVTVNPLPVPSITSSGSTVCLGSTVTLTANGGATYQWSNGSTNAAIAVTAANIYSVTATSAEGCSASVSETVVFNANPAVTISANGPTVFCQGGSLTLTANGGTNYQWNNGTIGASATVNQSGNYYVIVTNAAGCTSQSALVNVIVNANPVVAAITGANAVCEGGNMTLTSSTPGGVWNIANNFIANIDGAGNVTGLNAGTTTATYTVSSNGCSSSATAQINVMNNPVTPTITASGATSVCPGSSVVLFASNAANYQWSNGPTTPFVVATQSGSYAVTVTGLNGCSATSLPVTIFIGDNTNPVITAPLNVTVTPNLGCEAIGVTLGTPITSDNCSVANVSNDAPAIYPIGTTTVTWTVTDASGNTATATQIVTVVDQTAPIAIAPANVTVAANNFCEATGVDLGTPNVSDNCTANLVVTNNAPSTYPLGNTTVTWTITDAAGNVTTIDQTVTVVDETAPVVLLASKTLILDANGNATLDFTDVDNGSYDNCGIASAMLSQSSFDCANVGNNFITVTLTDNSGNQAFAVVMVLVVASDACGGSVWSGPVVPDAFTPNGNSINDTWVIPGLEGYNTKDMTVYSRYGTVVYYSNSYNNDWDGTLLNSGTPVPDGTYYYILNLDGGKQLNGFVYINRVKQ